VNCLNCHAEITNGLTLCNLCQKYAQTVFDNLPIYYTNLARWTPGRAGSRPVPGSRVLYDGHNQHQGTGDRISDRLDETNTWLTEKADKLADARPYLWRLLDRLNDAHEADTIDDAQRIAWLCRGFAKFLPALATLNWAGDFITELEHHETTLRSLTEDCVPGWYAGACRNCQAPTFVVPGLTWVTCGGCGSTTYARDHLDIIRAEASEWVASPKHLAEAIVALVDTEQSIPRLYDRIRKWASRTEGKHLTAVIHSTRGYIWDDTTETMVVADVPTGRARYRMGDVLDLLHNTPHTAHAEMVARTA